jgi:hypothetical protein
MLLGYHFSFLAGTCDRVTAAADAIATTKIGHTHATIWADKSRIEKLREIRTTRLALASPRQDD